MKFYLAGCHGEKKILKDSDIDIPYLLESYYYLEDWLLDYIKNHQVESFMLDSGAFTFLEAETEMDFDEYTDRYIETINEIEPDYFYEMDIDKLVGYDKVVELRKRIESKTGRRCIPVWHYNRGKNEYLSLVKKYDYVAIGGFAIGEIDKYKHHEIVDWFIKQAHLNDCKVHGLGLAREKVEQFPDFDSVDSTQHLNSIIYGVIYEFNGRRLERHEIRDEGVRAKRNKGLESNLKEWIKYTKFLSDEF